MDLFQMNQHIESVLVLEAPQSLLSEDDIYQRFDQALCAHLYFSPVILKLRCMCCFIRLHFFSVTRLVIPTLDFRTSSNIVDYPRWTRQLCTSLQQCALGQVGLMFSTIRVHPPACTCREVASFLLVEAYNYGDMIKIQ